MVHLKLSVDIFWEFAGKVPGKKPSCYIGYTHLEQQERGNNDLCHKEAACTDCNRVRIVPLTFEVKIH